MRMTTTRTARGSTKVPVDPSEEALHGLASCTTGSSGSCRTLVCAPDLATSSQSAGPQTRRHGRAGSTRRCMPRSLRLPAPPLSRPPPITPPTTQYGSISGDRAPPLPTSRVSMANRVGNWGIGGH